jgi:hypothetical protein
MKINEFKIIYKFNKKEIVRTGDLVPTGIKSTVSTSTPFNQAWEHIYKEIRKK